MTQNNISKALLQKPKFEWNKINSEFRFKQGSKYTRIPLKPTLKIQQNAQNSKIQTKIHIDTEKSLQYENEIGWNWHKSSNLPIISIKLEIRDVQKDILLLPPANLEARIYAAKFVVNTFEKDQVAYLEDVGIRGPNNIQLRQGCGFFNGVRFSSTSYNNEGVKFYLVIVVYLNDENSDMQSNIICSLLSPPIFVDSRKSARDYQEKRFLSFVQLFDPAEFSKLFKKRQTRNNANDFQTQIANNFDGLYNYLTAPNIRHKVKHPLFLSVKFSNVFKIFYNKNHQSFQQKKITAVQIIKKLQKKLVKQVGGQKKLKKSDDVNKKLFIISMVTNSNESKKTKVMNALEYLDCKSIFIAQFEYMITQSFVNIDTIQNIVQAYAQIYPTLQILSQKQISARKTREIQYQRSQKDLAISPKQQIQNDFVKKEYQQNINCHKSQTYYPNRSRNQNDSQQDNFSEDGNFIKNKYKFKSSQQNNLKRFKSNDQFHKKQKNQINNRIDNTLLQNNLIHPNNSLNNSLNLMHQIQDMGLQPILENPIIKQDPSSNINSNMCLLGQNMSSLSALSNFNNLTNLAGLNQSNFSNNIGMHNMNSSLQSYYQFQLSRIRNNQNRQFILKDLLEQVISKGNLLNKMQYDNEILKNKILSQINHNNQIFHEMSYMAALQNDRNNNVLSFGRTNIFQNQPIFDDKNNSLMAGFKQISSQHHYETLQKQQSLQMKQENEKVHQNNIITIKNSSSLSEDHHPNSNSINSSQKQGKIMSNQVEQSMSSMQCKFEQNIFHFGH